MWQVSYIFVDATRRREEEEAHDDIRNRMVYSQKKQFDKCNPTAFGGQEVGLRFLVEKGSQVC